LFRAKVDVVKVYGARAPYLNKCAFLPFMVARNDSLSTFKIVVLSKI
jgi:hypothetical protein